MCKVSILIPVYNTSEYLKRCLDSVINQTLKEIEIIIVNDGSIDNSENIIKSYMEFDKRIVYYKQENKGLGETRNKGIELSSGIYLAFLDSDDWVDRDFYEKLYKKAEMKGSDLVISSYKTVFKNGNTILNNIKNYEKEEYLKEILSGDIAGFSWNKLYKKDLITKNNLKFPSRGEFENVEDQHFSIRCVYYSKNIDFMNQSYIYYRINENSIVNRYQKGLINDIEKLNNENIKLLGKNKGYINFIENNILKGILSIINNEFKCDRKAKKSDIMNLFKEINSRKLYKNSLNNIGEYNICKKDKIYYKLLVKQRYNTLFIIANLRCIFARMRG